MGGPRLYAMAWRNLWRNRRRTLVTLSALVFGFLLAILMAGVSDRSLGDSVDLAARMGAGHVTLQHPELLDTPSTKRTVRGVDGLERMALGEPGVAGAVHRVTGQMMLATAGQNQAATFIAYDPRAEDPRTLPLLDAVRPALGYAPDEATFVALFLRDHRKAERVARALGGKVGPDVASLTWREVNPDLAAFIATKYGGLLVMGVIMLLLTAAGIFNTLFVSVMERLREFGILLAIGFSPGRLFRLVIWESLWLGLVGLAAGAVATALPYRYLLVHGIDLSAMTGGQKMAIAGAAMSPVLRVGIQPENAIAITAVILLATLLSGLYPAWRAGRVVPVEAIKLV